MDRLISILCLSDLHLEAYSDGDSVFKDFISRLYNEISNKHKPYPDYLVIAGDIICAGKMEPADYSIVIDRINEITSSYRIDDFNVIAVPGNHDKYIKQENLEIEQKKIVKFYNYLNATDGREKFDVVESFASNFENYSRFYTKYLKIPSQNEKHTRYTWCKDILGDENKSLYSVSGLKIFDKDKICFLTINTEWAYLPQNTNKIETPRLFPALINYSLKEIRREYPDYRVVTIMHRNPSEFSWSEKNLPQEHKIDIVYKLYNYSDIIITGHDHIERLLPPDKMANKAQLFKLGSTSMNSRTANEVAKNATMLYIDSINNAVRVETFRYNNLDDEWEVSPEKIYELPYKYDSSVNDNSTKLRGQTIYSKSTTIEDITEAIKLTYKHDENYCKLIVDKYDRNDWASLKAIIDNNNLTHLVLYSLYQPVQQITKNSINDEFHDYIIDNKLVISFVTINVPLISREDDYEVY